MSFLPKLRNTSAPSKVENVAFFGLDRNENASDGYFSDTRNVTSRDFPFISSRDPRLFTKLPDGMELLGMGSGRELYFVLNDGEKSYFYYGDKIKGEWEDKSKRKKFFCEVSGTIYIFPDRKFFRMQDDEAIAEYSLTHSNVGKSGYAYIKVSWSTYHTLNKFIPTHENESFEFSKGDYIKVWAYAKGTGEKVQFFDIPMNESVELMGESISGADGFTDVYFYNNGFYFDTTNQYYAASDNGIKMGYEFACPPECYEKFGSFANESQSYEIFKDEDDYQYLLLSKKTVAGSPETSNFDEEFLKYNYQAGMEVHFSYTDEDFTGIVPKSAVIEETGVDVFEKDSNNKSYAPYLKFAPGTFAINNWTENKYVIYNDKIITVSPNYPHIQGAESINNRLWGYKDDTIFASSLGKPYIMTSYKGLSTDSWFLETGVKRNFTGVISFGTVPHFFSEDKIIKVYGDSPSSYSTSETVCSGVKDGSGKSLVLGQGNLYYLDKDGFIASYTGSYPHVISRNLNEEFVSAVGCSDSRFIYYILTDKNGHKWLYTYDLLNGVWLLDKECDAEGIIYHDSGVYISKNGFIEHTDEGFKVFEVYTESGYKSVLEFPVNDEGVFNQKKLKKILLKINAEKDSSICVEVRETESAEFIKLFERTISGGDEVLTVPIDCRRTLGYSIRITGKGKWRLEGIMRRVALGSYKS